MLRETFVPDRYARAQLDRVLDPGMRAWLGRALDAAPEWLAPGYGFYIHGPGNTGKSSVAGLFLREALLRAERALWLHVSEAPGVRFRSTPRAEAMSEALNRADLLVVDDLGAENYRVEGAGGGALEEVVRAVYGRDRTLIVTSNLHWSDLPGRYPPLFVSALRRTLTPVALVRVWPEAPDLPPELRP
jgi:DNA replication protein DnaC